MGLILDTNFIIMADGATYEVAVANAHTVVQEWIETATSLGRPIPEPKGKLAYA